jgi:hypothetical protein
MRIQVKRFVVGDWENLQKELFLWTQTLVASSSSMPFPQYDPLVHKHFLHNFVLKHVGEYFQAAHVLTPFFALVSFNTTSTLSILHHELDGLFVLFLKDYKPN